MLENFLPTTANPGRILLVDDDPDHLALIRTQIKDQPFSITTATTGEEAMALCEKVAFEGILLDVNLPGRSGIEVCRELRQSTLNARTPRILISAVRMKQEDVLEGLEAEALDYLTWPYSGPELTAKLRMLVRLSRQQDMLPVAARTRALLEVASRTNHELNGPVSSVQLLVDLWRGQITMPTHSELDTIQELATKVSEVLEQLRNLRTYVARSYGERQLIPDMEAVRQAEQGPSRATLGH